MSETSDERISRMREQIAELFERDEEFARRSNLLLDDIVLTRDQADRNTRNIDQLTAQAGESRRDIDQLAERIGQLAQEISDLRQEVSETTKNVQILAFTSSQMLEALAIQRQTHQEFVEQAIADRQNFQAESRRIWEYLLRQNPNNGKGEEEG